MAVLLDAGATVECRPQHLLQFGVMGAVYAEARLGVTPPARGPAVDRRGGRQGQRAHARSLQAAQGGADRVHRATSRRARSSPAPPTSSSATGSPATSRSSSARGWSRRSKTLLGAELAEHVLEPGGLSAVAASVPPLPASGSTTRSTAARRCSASSGLVFVCHGRSSVKAIRNAVVAAARFAADDILGRVEQRVTDQLMGNR